MPTDDVLKLQRDIARLKRVLRVAIGWMASAAHQPLSAADMRLLFVLLDEIDAEDG